MEPKEIRLLIRDNLFQYYRAMGKSKCAIHGVNDHFEWIKSRSGSWPKMTFNLSESVDFEKVIDKLQREMKQDTIPPFFIVDDIHTEIDHQYIDSKGFKPVMFWKGMYLHCTDTKDPNSVSLFSMENVKLVNQLTDFVNVLNATLLKSNPASEDLFQDLLNDPGFNLHNGYVHDQNVATSLSFSHHTVGGLYMITTLEPFRRKGYGTKITYRAMNELSRKGIHHFVLHATKQGEKIYSKIGFKTFCNFYIYWLLGKK